MVKYLDKEKSNIGNYREGDITVVCWKCGHEYAYTLGSEGHGAPNRGQTINEFMFTKCPKCGCGTSEFVALRKTGATTLTAFFGGP